MTLKATPSLSHMITKILSIILSIILSFILSFTLLFTSSTLTASPFTLLETVPQYGFSLGNAITASTEPSIGNIVKNPAGLSVINTPQFKSSYSSFFNDTYKGVEFGYATPLSEKLTIGILVPIRLISDIPQTINLGGKGHTLTQYSDIEGLAMFGVGYSLSPTLKIGSTLSAHYHKIHTENLSQLTLDLGLIATSKKINLGLSIQEVSLSNASWSTGLKETSAIVINMGISYVLLPKKLKLLIDMSAPKRQKKLLNIGLLYRLSSYLNIHLGINNTLHQPKYRIGTQLNLGGTMFHYDFSNSIELGHIQKVGISLAL